MRYKLRKKPLQDWRRREGRSFRWLAARVGVQPKKLSDQMAGRAGVSLGTALALEGVLGVPVADLVEELSL